jgi:hypothetical protein
MTIHVYVWDARPGAWGHASMWLAFGPRVRQRYVSWWPQDPGRVPLAACGPACPRPPSYDWRMEGGPPSRAFRVPNVRGRIDVAAMASAWDTWTRQDCYSPLDRNCCTTVARLLREAGGAAALCGYSPVLWWEPDALTRYLRALHAVEPLQELYAMRIVQPSDLVPRAPASVYFSHMESRAVSG